MTVNQAMICAVISGPSIEEAKNQLLLAETDADIVEWRLDHFANLDLQQLAPLKRLTKLPSIFTLRAQRQGGKFQGTESARLHIFESMLVLNPSYVDLEFDVPLEFILRIRKDYPSIKIISSYHDFATMPEEQETLLSEMRQSNADLYKIAVKSSSTNDALKLLLFNRQHSESLITVGMGEAGQITRILSPMCGNGLTYAKLDNTFGSAPGQLSISDLNLYRYHALKPGTALLGLIGGNVERSFGHISHNAVMGDLGLDAVYIKMALKDGELKEFFELIKGLNVLGLSVTMPLKEIVFPFLDEIDPKAAAIGAVNTIHFKNGKAKGYNTDCLGAINALESVLSMKDKKMVVLGAGGAARAIAYEAKIRGVDVTILNRHPERALQLAEEFGCGGGGIEMLSQLCEQGYDILVNATPTPMPIEADDILSGSVVMDINNRPMMTPFLEAAKKRECRTVPGYMMFVEQAVQQFRIWFEGRLDKKRVKKIICDAAEKVLSI